MFKLSSETCTGMTLSTIPPLSHAPNLTFLEQVQDFHLSLSSILSHLFFLQLDWVTNTDCGGYRHSRDISRQHRKILTHWQTVTCVFIRSIPLETLNMIPTELGSNMKRVTSTPINRYTSCQMRKSRDCVLMTQAVQALNRLEMFYLNQFLV